MHRVLAMRGAVTSLVLGLLGADARAEETDVAQAKRLATSAKLHFDLGDYQAAIDEYGDAYRLAPRPGFLYNLGQSYRLSGDCVAATTMYRNYLRLSPSTPHRPMVEQHLGLLDECVEVGRTRKRAGVAISGTGIVAAGLGAWLAMRPIDEGGDDDDRRGDDDGGPDGASIALISGGLVAAVAGAAIYYLGWRDQRRAERAALAWEF